MKDQNKRLIPEAETKAADGEDRTLLVTITTSKPDRSGDVVVPEGGDLKHFKKNPVVLFGHNYHQPPIARAEQLKVIDNGIQAKVVFPEEGVYEFADTVYRLYKAGIMSAWSIGFIAKEAVNLDPDKPWGPQRFEKWEMLEFSAVPVPANPEALTLLRNQGIDDTTIKSLTAPSAESEEEKKEAEEVAVTVELKRIEYDLEAKTATCTLLVNGKEQQVTGAMPEPNHDSATPDMAETLKALRDALKPADKEIGLALRTLKQLLENPTS